ncbi:hypothetical protein ACFQDG_05795 [Natronoarchaeum mannanilyticum]|uniref:DUF7344 domain-containing protein n=1 Tax=Natronoarchaeum mannanilyticum TaxID=926360 RepID=A0AAV3T949_9EURY
MAQQQLPAAELDDVRDDETLEALANVRRRLALDCLPSRGESAALAELARRVAVSEAEGTTDAVSEERIERVKRTLYHVHLPKLDDVGLVAFDADERTVERAATR